MEEVRARIRDIPDFPQKGIVFKDITPVLSDPRLFRAVIDAFVARWREDRVQKVVGIESRGFLFAAPLAYVLGAGVSVVRKPGKLPWHVIREVYSLEYGENALELHVDAVSPGDRVLVVDDVLATGGTAEATGRLVARQGGTVLGYSFLVELGFLEGAKRLGKERVHSLIRF
ncbi:MAG TPA: adenine phosphoribosyltransferase [Anaeromyxobacter sp.]|nr:adenine phosphoribosyltransferase [Anaeromyxobacter sp.]